MGLTRWLGSGLASLGVGAASLCAAVAACGDDGAAGAGEVADTGLTDTMPADARKDATDAGPLGNAARLTLINAAHDLGPASGVGASAAIRVCFKQGSAPQSLSVAPYPPLPTKVVGNTSTAPPGIYYGAGATLPTVGLDLAGRILVPILVNVRSLSTRGLDDVSHDERPHTCDQLVGDTADPALGLRENTDYWVLPPIEAGTLANGKAYLVAITGCVGDAKTINPGKCGPGFVAGGGRGRGSLRLTIVETAQPSSAPAFGAQLLYLSTQANAFFSQAAAKGSIEPGFVSSPLDGGGFRPITDVSPPPSALSEIVPVQNVQPTDAFVFGPKSLDPADALRGVPLLPSSLEAIQGYSGLSTAYASGGSYVFVAVGDPDTNETKQFLKPDGTPGGEGGPGSRFNTRFFHFLAFPTDPPVEPFAAP